MKKRLLFVLMCLPVAAICTFAVACVSRGNNAPAIDPKPPIANEEPEEEEPQTPVTPPIDDENEKVEQAEGLLNNFINQLSEKKNFTYTDSENNKVEIDGNKAKLTTNGKEEFIEETQEENFNYYTGADEKIHRKNEEEKSIEQLIASVTDRFIGIEWTEVSGNTLQGKKNAVTVSCTLENNKLSFTSSDENFSINKVKNTTVAIPAEYVDDNFKVEENIDTLLTNLDQGIRAAGTILKSDNFYVDNLYLKKGSSIVDTVGVILHRERNNGDDYGFCIGEAQLSGLTEDLTYQSICEKGLPTGFKVQGITTIKNFNLISSRKTTYQESIDILFNQLIGPDSRDDAKWWGYDIDDGITGDTHKIYLFKDNKLYEKNATVYHEAGLGLQIQAVEQNFKDKPQSDSTWRLDKDEVYTIPEDSIDIYKREQEEILYSRDMKKLIRVPVGWTEPVTIPASITSIEYGAFADCANLQTVTFAPGSKLKSIGSNAFTGCTSLTSIEIPSGVTSIGNQAFNGCTDLQTVNFADGSKLETIGERTFNGCSNLTSIEIPSGVTSIGRYAFYGCTDLQTVTFNDDSTLKSIGDYAFYGCLNLIKVTIPASVTKIGTDAFNGCYKLIEVYNKSNLQIVAGNSTNGYVAYRAKNVYSSNGGSKITTHNDFIFYEDNSKGEYYLMGYAGDQKEMSLPSIGHDYEIYRYAFYVKDIAKVTIPTGVTTIGYEAFYGCSNLTSITISASVTSIEYGAFYGCTNLQTVTFSGTSMLKSIPDYAFYLCRSLTSITIPASVTYIGKGAFGGCNLQAVTFKNPSGWKVSRRDDMSYANDILSSDLRNESKAAEYLRKAKTYGGYEDYYWQRS